MERTATAQSTASLVSRPSHSRRHRTGRSHQGGSSNSPSNDFPIFTYTGDTEIVIRAGSQEKRYLLHRLILAQCSGFFEASTSEDWSCQTTLGPSKPEGHLSPVSEDDYLSNGSTLVPSDHGAPPTRPGEKRRWRYELDWENCAEDEEVILVQKVSCAWVYLEARLENANGVPRAAPEPCPRVWWRPSGIPSHNDQAISCTSWVLSIHGEPDGDAISGTSTPDRRGNH